jgi:hypothetical protein
MIEILSSLAPAVGGFFASIASSVIGEITAEREHKRSMENRRFDRETAAEMAKFGAAEAVRQHDRDQDGWNWQGLETSLAHDTALVSTSPWVSDFRSMVRPGITVASVAYLALGNAMGWQALPVLEDIAMTSVFWWFGSRTIERSHPRVYSASDWRRTNRPVAPSRMEPRELRDPAGLAGTVY